MQISMFDGDKPFKVNKPLRLITLFSGYDSQALALKYLGVPFEHYRTCEWAIPSIQALKDLHFEDDDTDYSVGMSKTELVEKLYTAGVSADYNVPLTKAQLQRYGEGKLRTIYNNIRACHNLVSICNAKGDDLGIKETDKYCYLLTYSFPCQDLSAAGLGKGMERGSGTRSGMLWEVERLLKETKELPQILLMENVKQVIGKNNIKAFAEWVAFLDKLGYHSKWQVINATDFSIPQNRERCFMVSVLGNHYYEFPKVIGNNLQLKDVLEKNVADRYYLSEKIVETYYKRNVNYIIQRSHSFNKGCKIVGLLGGKFEHTLDLTRRVYDVNAVAPTITTCGGGNTEPKIMEEKECDYRVRKLTERECGRLMGVKDDDIAKIGKNLSRSAQYHMFGDSIVTSCLMAIFGKMFNVDYESKIKELTKKLTEEG